jgi:hypothetical protein
MGAFTGSHPTSIAVSCTRWEASLAAKLSESSSEDLDKSGSGNVAMHIHAASAGLRRVDFQVPGG